MCEKSISRSTRSTRSTRNSVQFGDVTFREFPMQLSDNPAVSAGVPVGLGWDCVKQYRHQLAEYEHCIKRKRSGRSCSKLDPQYRAQLLMKSGYTVLEIVDAVVEATEIQKQRASSARDRNWEVGSFYKGLVDSVVKAGKSPGNQIRQLVSYQSKLSRSASFKFEKPKRSKSSDLDNLQRKLSRAASFKFEKPKRQNSLDLDDILADDTPTLRTKDDLTKPNIRNARSA
ncbi:MAG: hypothetical protein SGBAC_011245 [Bacillariaceae sp.]